MTVSGTAIDRKTADGAREDLEQHNQDLIAKCKAEGSSPIVRLEVGQTLARLYSACEDFAKVNRTKYLGQQLLMTLPTGLRTRQPNHYY